jgi:hypothetical protein
MDRAGFKGGATGAVAPWPPHNRKRTQNFTESFESPKITKCIFVFLVIIRYKNKSAIT